jgi:YggT family protein
MLAQIILFILDSVCSFLTLALLVRFTLQIVHAPFRNPLGQFVIAVTDWIVRPARRLVPGLFGYDLASLLLAWLAQAIYLGIALGLSGTFTTAPQGYLFHGVSPAPTFMVAALALLETTKIELYLLIGAVLVSAIFSWVNPYAPLAAVFNAVSQPLLRPFQRFIPPIGGVDLSPLALLLLLQIGLMLLERLRLLAIMP